MPTKEPDTILKTPCEKTDAGEALDALLHGYLHAYFIYDVADTIDLSRLLHLSPEFEKAQIELRVGPPGHIQYEVPPLSARLNDCVIDGVKAEARLKIFDYGIISIRLSFACSGVFADFADFVRLHRQSANLGTSAEALLNSALKTSGVALRKPHDFPLLEEYFVIEVNSCNPPQRPSRFLAQCKQELAALLVGESMVLSNNEIEEALRMQFRYLDSDMAIVHCDSAIVMENREGAEAVESILEFANTQLVELRTYDARLDAELDEISKWDLARTKPHWLFGRKAATERTDRLRNLLIDIRELSDRGNNALKFIGDAFYARLYRGVASRLGLRDWQEQIESKLDSLGEIYEFATDQAQHARSEFLETIIILLILVEIILGLLRLTG